VNEGAVRTVYVRPRVHLGPQGVSIGLQYLQADWQKDLEKPFEIRKKREFACVSGLLPTQSDADRYL